MHRVFGLEILSGSLDFDWCESPLPPGRFLLLNAHKVSEFAPYMTGSHFVVFWQQAWRCRENLQVGWEEAWGLSNGELRISNAPQLYAAESHANAIYAYT